MGATNRTSPLLDRRHSGTFGEMAASGGMRRLGRERSRRQASVRMSAVGFEKQAWR